MKKGKIVFLNGASSSGKTALAKALQAILDEPYLHFCVDTFLQMLPDRIIYGEGKDALPTLIPMVVSGMHRCIAASASVGNHIIVDHVLQAQPWLEECVDLLSDFPVLFVGVRCPLEVLEQRERGRDREPGLARIQIDLVHGHGIYDIEVDTSKCNPRECAVQVEEALHGIDSADAFQRLREALPSKNG